MFRRLYGRKQVIRPGTRLLLLRVFALGRESQGLFAALDKHWRHVGSIQMIAGPDLATTTVEPHEFLDFLRGRLARRFIDSQEALEVRLAEMDLERDQDGRFRVNDFFCREEAWRMTLCRLVDRSEVVLMDLRRFSPRNAGCIFEINTLIGVMPADHVVFVIDNTTDESFFRQTIRNAWNQMPPGSANRRRGSPTLRLIRLDALGRSQLRRILRALCIASTSTYQTSLH